MIEPTPYQQDVIDRLAERFHLVIVEDAGRDSLCLQVANFCTGCGGDGFRTEPDALPDCEPCGGTGGVPVLFPPVIVPSVCVGGSPGDGD